MAFSKYREIYNRIQHFSNIQSILNWDSEVTMPAAAREERSFQIAEMTKLIHEIFTGSEFARALEAASNEIEKNNNDPKYFIRKRELEVITRRLDKQKKLPTDFVTKLSQKTNIAHAKWVEAKKQKDFNLFSETLSELVDLAKVQADYYGYENERYDALLDDYERGATGTMLSELFDNLKKDLVPIVSKAKSYPNPFKLPIDAMKQKKFCELLPPRLGLSHDISRLDISAHPFSTSLGSKDKRITTRYDELDPLSAVFGVLHETGHSLYEAGLSEMPEAPNPLAEFLSLGIHESQSRLWENQVGRSREFWNYYYPVALESWELKERDLPFDDFFNYIQSVQKSKIRVEADPVTYNLHIILRFEIERDLIADKIKVSDLPELWRSKMQDYFGLKIDNDAEGVLQDVHWSMAAFGYFPTYALGNIYSAQLYEAFLRDNPVFKDHLTKTGETKDLLEWLKKNVHHQGRIYEVPELIEKATGSEPSSASLIKHLSNI
ncbi:carboxypeptidase M32 [Leptospira sp. GIMC2001]|uniref:carboxypeptidase M32 n=1 Tax=Leptospira sp. GIMC2001 TaxID=1513297 RepID=UPI0023497145|nr:carboxypeptidase M32 [Leptospira sp. GIMC2001]WCL49486.1 carboxypeptidase M32 [Leptospira sp. GIMC2001]